MSAPRGTNPAGASLLAAVALAVGTVGLGGCGGASSSATAAAPPTEIVTATFPAGRDTDEVSPTGAKPVRPCSLVTKPQAEGILGAGVRVSEELQGPTCVYSGSGRQVSLVVEKVPLKALRKGARRATAVSVDGRRGWCLSYETTSLVVAVGQGRVLQATGPCAAGTRFAALALPRL